MAKGYHHLTHPQRCQIQALKSIGLKQITIAETIGVSTATISRELRRNRGQRGYRQKQAHRLATERRHQASATPSRMTPALIATVTARLQLGWSPEQIAGRLKRDSVLISHESIYRLIWRDKKLGGVLYKQLRHQGKKYNKRGHNKAGRGFIRNRVDIAERPEVVEKKSRIGDWEGDTIVGAGHRGALVTHVDRKSKLTLISKVTRRTADEVQRVTESRFLAFPRLVKTITYDNGKEFAYHEGTAITLNARCYFATPYCSWERGLNEHTNGLIRGYFPKSTHFDEVTEEDVQRVENLLNNRPRKVLNYLTPKEVFKKAMKPHELIALRC